jgi:ATP-binding protein involved in chromosome partitioning
MTIRETSDAGLPIVATKPDSPQAAAYRAIAERVREQLAGQGAAKPAPKIVIEA